ncbi:MAG: hypothetical protein HZA17_13905 [Nitrospirae bacterium]|nr:hypothetical protein [Nitrospirota bacterium]
MNARSGITRIINALFFLYLLFVSLMGYLFDPESHRKVPWDEVHAWSPTFAMIAAFLMGLFLVFWGAALVKIFWNRFIADVFKVRDISFDESLAIILIIAIVAI